MYRLLIVDDEREIRNGLSNYFPWEELGFKVLGCVENGKKAIDFVDQNDVDIVLCDIVMPVMSGLELAKELHQRRSCAKIIFLSGYKDFEYAKKALEYGVSNYIVKSTKFDELVTAFRTIKSELDFINSPGADCNILQNCSQIAGTKSYTDKIISNIKNYVESNLKTANLNNAAQCAHMNPFYLSRFFKQHTGENFSDYVTEVKMKKAAQLLGDINMRLYDISEAVGYTSPTNFARTFKNHFGKSPREYRNGDSL